MLDYDLRLENFIYLQKIEFHKIYCHDFAVRYSLLLVVLKLCICGNIFKYRVIRQRQSIRVHFDSYHSQYSLFVW